MQIQFWNFLIKIGGILAGIGWNISLVGDGFMEVARVIGFGAKNRLESEAQG